MTITKKLAGLVLFISVISAAKDSRAVEWTSGTLLDVSFERGSRLIDGGSYRNDVTYYPIEDDHTYI